jgi:hypothetical protein
VFDTANFADLLENRLSPIVQGLADIAEFTFLDGPVEVCNIIMTLMPCVPVVRFFCLQLPLEDGQAVQVRRWWPVDSSPHEKRQTVLAAASQAWKRFGPFDAVAGFSEGGAVAHMLAVAAAKITEFSDDSDDSLSAFFASIKLAIFFSAFCPDGCPPVSSLKLPALHVFSGADTAVSVGQSIALADMYSNGVRYSHADGHCVPMRSKDKATLSSFLRQFTIPLGSHLNSGALPNSRAPDAAYDIPHGQEEEQSALASIFENDYNRVTTNPVQCQIAIGWQKVSSTAHSDLLPWIFLLFTLNSHYLIDPLARPALRLCTKERNMIGPEHEISILNAATQAIIACGGEPAIFAATSAARDWIDAHLPNGPSVNVDRVAQRSTVVDGPTHVNAWWEVDDIDMAEVQSASAAAGSVLYSEHLLGKEAGTAAFNHEWKLTVGLVGKPSSGKSTFFNAACRPSNSESAARMAAHPFTTIEPNIGQAFAALPCPCVSVGLSCSCCPLYGHANSSGTRHVPVIVKDVAGLVPGAYQGKGRGNAFLNDLVNCDVLIHVVDASGKTTSSGVEGEGDPRHDIDWVVSKLPIRAVAIHLFFFLP